MTKDSPLITNLSWGQTGTEAGSFKDAKLWPGGAREWDWKETGTEHTPGIQPADVAELLEREVDTVILSTGQEERLKVMDETIEHLKEAGVETIVLETTQAVDKYNELAKDGQAVGALIHSTC